MQDPSELSIDFYHQEALSYDQKRWRTPAGRYVDETQRSIVRALVGDCSAKTVLDVATGTGRFALDLARMGAAVTALDSSAAMLDLCAENAAQEGLAGRIRTVHGVATKMALPDSSFDICVCINAMNHIPDHQAVLRELSRTVRAEGLVVTNYTNLLSYFLPAGIVVKLRRRSIREDVYTYWFTLREIRALHRHASLHIDGFLGAVQIPVSLAGRVPFLVLRNLDRLSRDTLLRWLAPQVFIKARKVGPT